MSEPLPSLREVMNRHDIVPKRSLGQNFLLDGNLTDKVARAAGSLTQGNVIEVGPGPGGLTRSLLQAGATVYAIEKDTRCVAALQDLATAADGKLHIIEADALKMDTKTLAPAPRKIAANLPYNIATVLLLGWLKDIYCDPGAYESLTLMFQKEVAERITAIPGTKAYGRLSVISQWLCETRHEFDIPPAAFVPPPKVTSSVITLTPRAAPSAPAEMDALEKVVAAAFGQRRKMLRVALKQLGVDTEKLLTSAGITPTLRGEALSVAEFCRLAGSYKALAESLK